MVDPDHVLQRTGHEEVLLLEPQALPFDPFVVRVEHLRDVLRTDLLVDGAVVLALVEGVEIERLARLRGPQAKQVDGVDVIAGDRRVVGDPHHHLIRDPPDLIASPLVVVGLGPAAELHRKRDLGPGDCPGIAESQPFVGPFDLPAVPDLLIEDPELIPDAITDGGNLQRGQRFEKTRRQPTEASVAQAGLFLLVEKGREIEPQLLHGRMGLVVNPQIQKVDSELGPEEELGRQVTDGSAPLQPIRLGRSHPPLQDPITDSVGEREVAVVERRHGRKSADGVEQAVGKCALERLDRRAVADVVTFVRANHGCSASGASAAR